MPGWMLCLLAFAGAFVVVLLVDDRGPVAIGLVVIGGALLIRGALVASKRRASK